MAHLQFAIFWHLRFPVQCAASCTDDRIHPYRLARDVAAAAWRYDVEDSPAPFFLQALLHDVIGIWQVSSTTPLNSRLQPRENDTDGCSTDSGGVTSISGLSDFKILCRRQQKSVDKQIGVYTYTTSSFKLYVFRLNPESLTHTCTPTAYLFLHYFAEHVIKMTHPDYKKGLVTNSWGRWNHSRVSSKSSPSPFLCPLLRPSSFLFVSSFPHFYFHPCLSTRGASSYSTLSQILFLALISFPSTLEMCGHGTPQRTDRRVFSLTPVRSIILLIVFISYHNLFFSSFF